MRNSSGKNKKGTTFNEWRRCFLDEAAKDGHALIALKRLAQSKAERFVVLELLFHHVNGNYGLGADARDWNAFRGELNSLRRRALAFASEIKGLRHLKIFSGPLMPAAFLAREGGAFGWHQTIEMPREVFWSEVETPLTQLVDYIKLFITEGDKTWDFRDFGNLNLILLSIYLKWTTGEWQDEGIAMLVRTAYRATGKRWKSERNPGAAIAEIRRRFSVAESRFEWLLLALDQTPTGRLIFRKRQRERELKKLPPIPPFLKRYPNRASMQRDLERAFKKRHRFRDLSSSGLPMRLALPERGRPTASGFTSVQTRAAGFTSGGRSFPTDHCNK